ncbi:dihydroneopterin aldolase [Pelistega suis]|uniref:7,8-dihydroneopterin aldolase n=1 Tax=Pelistega suis TaxID=1631957 RepID=A0A849P7N3_9BURK|nr:dihydroneopterin aldolase [Pelistega suis]MCQ9329670.1 dihydroneopterin aldolase [Pelistega suis]NOL52013.1 dihydroneopterin aldolase [Pelistega suis]
MLTQKIFFNRLRLDARIGILEHELRATQIIYIDAELDVNPSCEANDHDISTVLDYRKIREAIIEESTRTHVHLVEVLGKMITERLLRDFPEVSQVKLRISKPAAFSDCDAVGIEFVATR